MAEIRDLSIKLGEYRDRWVVFSNKTSKVISSGDSPKEAIENARKEGETDPVVTKVPKEYGNFVL